MKVIDNTSKKGIFLDMFIDSVVNDDLTLFHELLFLSQCYDIVIDNKEIIICDKEGFEIK